jgi:hypothetical protein
MPQITHADGRPLRLAIRNDDGTVAAFGNLEVSFVPVGPGTHIINDLSFVTEPAAIDGREDDGLVQEALAHDAA